MNLKSWWEKKKTVSLKNKKGVSIFRIDKLKIIILKITCFNLIQVICL